MWVDVVALPGVTVAFVRVMTSLGAAATGIAARSTTSSATRDAPIIGRVTLREDPFAGRARDMAGASAAHERAAMVLASPPGRDRKRAVLIRTGSRGGAVRSGVHAGTLACPYVAGSAH